MSDLDPLLLPPDRPPRQLPSLMLWLRSLLFGVLGLMLSPVLVMFVVLALAHIFDPRCGTPGDSGGCEMGAFGIGVASAIPGFFICFFVTLIRGIRRQAKVAKEVTPDI